MKKILCLALFLLVADAALGAAQNSIAPSRSHETWNRASGFPGGHIYSMTQTADGYLWIATNKGLIRYDGLNFVFVRRGDSVAITNDPVPGLVTDSSGQLWAIDDHTHLFRYKDGVLEGPVPDNGRHQYLVSVVNKSSDGWLLFVSELQGIVEYRHGEPRVLLEPHMLPGPPTATAQTADGAFWVGIREKGLFRFNPEKGEHDPHQVPGFSDKKINCLLPIANATLLIGTDKGLFALHHDNLTTEMNPELRTHEILALANGQQGDVWIGAGRQVFKANAKDVEAEGRIHVLEQLPATGTVTVLFDDRDGNLWIGKPDSLERYRDSSFITYPSSAGLPCTNCGAIYVDREQRVWFAPWEGGLFRISQGRVQSIEIAGLKDDTVYSITGANDEVWIARKNGGLTRLSLLGDGIQASTYSQQNGLAEDAIHTVYREANGTIWAGSLHRGLSRLRGDTWHTFTISDGLPSNTISVITGNAAGQIFVGTPTGLAVLTKGQWTRYSTHDGLPPGAIDSLFLDATDTLWIGTSRGIAFLRSGVVHVPLGAPDPLYEDILGIVESNGWLWITMPDHVLRVKRTALLNQVLAEGDYREFGVTDGLPSVAGIKRSPSLVLDHQGNVWFSLNQGLSFLPPSAFAGSAFPATARIDGMSVDGRFIATGDQIRIPSGRHRLTFQYAGVDISSPERLRYRYRLNEIDATWSEPTVAREIDFTNLAPGRFEFQVTARNPDGVWSPHVASIAFEVEPSLLQTRWFQAAAVGILALLAFGVYQLRVQQLHRQFHIGLEARVHERTRIARDLHDTLLQTLHALLFQFQAVRNLLPRRPDQAVQSLEDAISETEKALAESRDAIQGLRSEPIAKGDLAELLVASSQELARSGSVNGEPPIFDLVQEGERQVLSSNSKSEVCRIALEILRNAYRHAHAHRIEAEIRYGDHSLRVRIRDDGTGIDPKVLNDGGPSGHWGLRGARERAERIGAHLDIWSEASAGTEVQLSVPANVAYESSPESFGSRLRRKARRRA